MFQQIAIQQWLNFLLYLIASPKTLSQRRLFITRGRFKINFAQTRPEINFRADSKTRLKPTKNHNKNCSPLKRTFAISLQFESQAN
ncbi:MAG: hypothetical protein WBV73_01165 [Phormidium sp.]